MAENENKDTNVNIQKKKKKDGSAQQRMLISMITIAVIAVIAVIVIIVLLVKNNSSNQNNQSVIETSIVKQEYNFNNPDGLTASLKDKTAVVDYSNPEGSDGKIKYTIKLKDTKEVIYESDLLAPGDSLASITLNLPTDITAGEYDITIYMESYTLDGVDTGNGTISSKTLVVTE